MSKHSLRIGGGKFATKNTKLLGYGQGDISGKYVSREINWDRGSDISATRVGSDGLIKKCRENKFTYSNNFSQDNSGWGHHGLFAMRSKDSGTPQPQPGYDGTTDAALIIASAGGPTSHHRIQRDSISFDGIQTFSIYVKKQGIYKFFAITTQSANNEAYFNIESGTVASKGAQVIDAQIISVGGGWYRVAMTVNANITALRFNICQENGSTQFQGDAVSGVWIQDAQWETGLVLTDYIESTTTTTGKAGTLDDEPRIDYHNSSGTPHLLIEPQRTNLVTNSEYIPAYTQTRSSVKSGYTSPEGVKNAYKVVGNSESNTHLVVSPNFSIDAALSGEEIFDGGFDDASKWTAQTGVTVANSKATWDGSQSSIVPNGTFDTNGKLHNVQDTFLLSNRVYLVTYTISDYSAGSIRIKMGNAGYGTARSANGTYTEYIRAVITTFSKPQFEPDVNFVGSVDSVSVKEAITHTVSVFVKPDGVDYVRLMLTNTTVSHWASKYFDLKDKVVGTTSVGGSGTAEGAVVDSGIEDYGNGWYRIHATCTLPETTTGQIRLYLAEDDNDAVFVGNGEDGVQVYGFSCEVRRYTTSPNARLKSDYPTSYIPTYGHFVTRESDHHTAEITGATDSGILGNYKTSFLFDGESFRDFGNNRFMALFNTTGSGNDPRVLLYTGSMQNSQADSAYPASYQVRLQYRVQGQSDTILMAGTGDTIDLRYDLRHNRRIKALGRLNETEMSLFVNGLKITTGTGTITKGVATIVKGEEIQKIDLTDTNEDLGHRVKDMQFFPFSVTDNDGCILTSLTTYTTFTSMVDTLKYSS
jgi:hypothetical protein